MSWGFVVVVCCLFVFNLSTENIHIFKGIPLLDRNSSHWYTVDTSTEIIREVQNTCKIVRKPLIKQWCKIKTVVRDLCRICKIDLNEFWSSYLNKILLQNEGKVLGCVSFLCLDVFLFGCLIRPRTIIFQTVDGATVTNVGILRQLSTLPSRNRYLPKAKILKLNAKFPHPKNWVSNWFITLEV